MAKSSDDKCVWLRNTKQLWKVDLEVWVGVFGYFSLLLSLFVLAPIAAFLWTPAVYVVAALVFLYFAAQLVVYFVLYWWIRCPACHFNPTRRKSDGRPMSPRILYPRLYKYAACPACNNSGAPVA